MQPGDYGSAVGHLENGDRVAPEKEIEPLTRLQVIARTLNISTEYLIRANRHTSADGRLAAFDSMFAMLEGYVRASGVEMTDLMTQTDQLEAAKKDYGALVWEGASANDRLASLVRTLETWFGVILRARAWNTQDGRDVRYRKTGWKRRLSTNMNNLCNPAPPRKPVWIPSVSWPAARSTSRTPAEWPVDP